MSDQALDAALGSANRAAQLGADARTDFMGELVIQSAQSKAPRVTSLPRKRGVTELNDERRVLEAGTVAQALPRLVSVIQELSLARDLPSIMRIVRRAARELTGADGATFVLRDGDRCYYADEDAIGPLWRGRGFPMSACISGWVMTHGEAVVIEDVYADSRIPTEVYAPTFVKSLAMVPIRGRAPLGAIGNYWARHHRADQGVLDVLQALADSTAVAMENVEIRAQLERRVRERTVELEMANRELAAKHEALIDLHRRHEELNALVVHDLKSPATTIMLAASLRLRASERSDPSHRDWTRVLSSAEQIHRTSLNLLDFTASHEGKLVLHPTEVDIGALFDEVVELLCPLAELRRTHIELAQDVRGLTVRADAQLLLRVLQNLVDNAVRHSPTGSTVRLEAHASAASVVIVVSDSGIGVPLALREKLFDPCTRNENNPHSIGGCNGLGLTFCRLAVEAHGGRIWIEDNQPAGSRFCFRLPTCGSGVDAVLTADAERSRLT